MCSSDLDSITDAGMAAVVNCFFMVGDNIKSDDLKAERISATNIYLSERKMGLGWVEVAGLILDR